LEKVGNTWENIVQINCDTADVVSVTVQTDLCSHTANEVTLSDGEGKHVTHSWLENMR